MSLAVRFRTQFRGSPGATDTEGEFRLKVETAINLALVKYKERMTLYCKTGGNNENIPKATGTLRQSGADVAAESKRVGMGFLAYAGFAAPYAKYVDEGRPRGYFPPIMQIKMWCIVKGIPEEAAEAIAWKIFHHGIAAKHFWEDTKTYAKRALAEELVLGFAIMKVDVDVSF